MVFEGPIITLMKTVQITRMKEMQIPWSDSLLIKLNFDQLYQNDMYKQLKCAIFRLSFF